MFSDYALRRLGVREAAGSPRDPGDGRDAFRTPSLRGVSLTGPDMHNGTLETLDEVFRLYARVDRRLDPALAGVRGPDPREATTSARSSPR